MGMKLWAVALLALLVSTQPMKAGTVLEALEASGRGDYETAVKIWEPMAEQGESHAQNFLGVMYAKGQGVPQDYGLALQWWHKAAAQGNVDALSNLGSAYIMGDGVTQDFTEAATWFRK